MKVSNMLRPEPARMRVLGQGSGEPRVLQQHACLRCAKIWWPRRPSTPMRCPRCKSPYWDRPRRLKESKPAGLTPMGRERVQDSMRGKLEHTLGLTPREPLGSEDCSLAKALQMLKDMKAAGRTWPEMAERVEREFGTRLDKDQLKALVR